MGALTLKQFSNSVREWELTEGEGIDPTDGFGVDLRLSIRENQIFLAEPCDPDSPWLTDRGRLFFDGLFDTNTVDKKTQWNQFFEYFSEFLYFLNHLSLTKKKSFFFVIAFENVSLEILNILHLLSVSNSFLKLRKMDTCYIDTDSESSFFLNNSVEKSKLYLSTLGILLNTNTRHEGYVLNLSLRLRFLKGNFKLLSIGSVLDITLPTYSLGSNFDSLRSIGEGTHLTCQDIKRSKFPVLITNTELFKRKNLTNLYKIFKTTVFLSDTWNGVNILSSNLSISGSHLLSNFLPLTTEDYVNFLGFYFINVELNSVSNFSKLTELKLLNISNTYKKNYKKVLIEQNFKSFTEPTPETKSFFLPNNLVFEDNETYINTQGLIKRTSKLLNFKKNSKNNWQIIRKIYAISNNTAFFDVTNKSKFLNFDYKNSFNYKNYVNFQFLPSQNLISFNFYLTKRSYPSSHSFENNFKPFRSKFFKTKMKYWLDDFFMNNGRDSFSFNSTVLINCSKISKSVSTNFF